MDAIVALLSNATLQHSAMAPHRLVHCWAIWRSTASSVHWWWKRDSPFSFASLLVFFPEKYVNYCMVYNISCHGSLQGKKGATMMACISLYIFNLCSFRSQHHHSVDCCLPPPHCGEMPWTKYFCCRAVAQLQWHCHWLSSIHANNDDKTSINGPCNCPCNCPRNVLIGVCGSSPQIWHQSVFLSTKQTVLKNNGDKTLAMFYHFYLFIMYYTMITHDCAI